MSMKHSHAAIVGALAFLFALVLSPISPACGQAQQTPPPKKSKLDVAEEEETPAPKKPAGKSPVAEEAEAPPAKKTPSALSSNTPGAEDPEAKPERVCDHIFINQRAIQVALFDTPFKFPVESQDKEKEFKFKRLTSSEKGFTMHAALGSTVTGLRYYEDRMWQLAADALQLKPKRLAEPGATIDLSTPDAQERADKAEQILVTALAEHDSAVQANLRKGAQWDAMFRQPLMQALLNLRLSRADLLLAEGKLDPALRYCDNLLAEFSQAPGAREALRSRFERILLTQAGQAVDNARQAVTPDNQAAGYAEARRLLDEVAKRYPRVSGGAAEKFRDELINPAKDLVRQAEALPPDKARDAKQLLARAALIWPDLPGLETRRQQLDDQYRILHCAYTSLPQNFSPMLASSPVERHAVSLMFESLVRWWDGKADDSEDPGEGGHYEPQLAQGRPVSLSRGRQFYLHAARWSDSTANEPHVLTLADVQATVKLFANKSLPGHLPAWAGLVRSDVQPVHSDPFTACIWLDRDHWQPLSLMDFKILPQRSFPRGTREELELFNKSPVGTGPYLLGETLDVNQVRFVANPHYRQRGKPHINEIIFHRLPATTAKEQFLQGKIHLLYDVQPIHVAEIRQQRRTVKTVHSHSVWFLAPRYSADKRTSALDDVNLRLAIAHQIERDKILTQEYRAGNSSDHTELTGPYPRKSWANNPDEMSFSPSKAGVYIEQARAKNKNIPDLRLVFPDIDPTSATAKACTEIQKQLAAAPLHLNIKLVPVAPEEFAATVDAGNFDLAYWRHDFKDQCYWLWPLLDPQGIGPGGPNFMRYFQDQDLADLFTQLNSHKRFPEIRDLTRKVHRHIFEKAIVIPLWQLDTYVAVDDALRNVRLDPWVLYGNVEEWDLQLRTK